MYVDYFVDNYRTDKFWGNDVVRLSDIENVKDVFFYVSSPKYYDEIKKQLTGIGLSEFDDFVKGGCFDRKVVFLNANCYGSILAIYLGSNKEFVSKYFIYDVTPIQEKNASEFPDKLLSVCDVYLGQDIRKENKFGIQFSDEYIVERLRPDCKRIIFPNLVGMGKMMFIQSYYEAGGKNADAAMPYGFFPYGDSVIDRLYEEGYSAEEIIIEIAKGKFFSEEQIRSNFDEMVEQFKKRERNWDVKIVDYILENYRERQVFYDLYHHLLYDVHYLLHLPLIYKNIKIRILTIINHLSL